MKLSRYTPIIVVTLVFFITLGWSAPKASTDSWEYKIVSKNSGTTLTQLGMEGWELVAIEEDMHSGTTTDRRYVLKRPKK